jgi:DTW domain-containing protein YfiP
MPDTFQSGLRLSSVTSANAASEPPGLEFRSPIDHRALVARDDAIMARSVVLRPSTRCPQCRMPPRWCICEGFRTVACSLSVDVLMDHVEQWRPSSTGMLINRLIPGAGQHAFRRGVALDPAAVRRPGKDLWILHPRGDPWPKDTAPADVQVLLLDGAWREAAVMLRKVEGWGRKVSLPMTGESRYWLRTQAAEGRFSTIEALMFLLGALGLNREETELQLQFELHVYAGLLARGKMVEADRYLVDSPVRAAFPELAARLRG